MKYSTKIFIEKAKKVHGDKYDYSKAEYTGSKNKICIICPEHGEFWQLAANHIRGCGCWACGGKKEQNIKLKTNEEFISEAKLVHNGKYDYSKVNYIGSNKKVCIICPEHGEFWQNVNHHLQGKGCPKCGRIKRDKSCTHTLDDVKNRCQNIHGNKYEIVSKTYNGSNGNLLVKCGVHGVFKTTANKLLQGHGCPMCAGLNKTTETWINEAKKVHGDKYDYSKVEYCGSSKKVCIICPKHGEFWQYAHQHLQGRGCPHCKQSLLEKEIRDFLNEEKIKFIAQKRSKWLDKQSLDFYLPDYNIAIECQGIQHFKPSDYFGGIERYNKTVKLDKEKHIKCKNNNIDVLYYTHYKFDYEFELIDNLKTLKSKINESISKNSNHLQKV